MSTTQLFKVYMNENVSEMLKEVLSSGTITQGKKVEEFESKLKKYFDWPYVVTVNSATSGLTLAYHLLNIKNTDKIISTPLTCFATTCAILTHTKHIVWADTDPDTCNIDLEDVKSKINYETKALSFVHWGGVPVDLDKVDEIKKYAQEQYGIDLAVVEDCAHSFGAEWKDKKLGTHGNIAVYSLQAIKHLTTGDGGIILLPNEEMYKRAKLLRWYGIDRERRSQPGSDFRLEPNIEEWGYKFHMNDINATIGIGNLPYVQQNIKICRYNAEYFDKHLDDCINIKKFVINTHSKPSYWIYTIKILNGMKPFFIEYMKTKQIVVSQVHARNDKHSCVENSKTKLCNLDSLEKEIVCIPCGWWLSLNDLDNIIKSIKYFDNSYMPQISILKNCEYIEYVELLQNTYNNITFNKQQLYNNNNSLIFVLKVGDRIISSAKLLIEEKINNSLGHIEDVMTVIDKRGFGFAKKIIKYVIEYARNTLNCYKVVLSARKDLEELYIQCGLEASGISFSKKF